MAGLNSWLSPALLHALGWALIHSLWQCAAIGALAGLAMAFMRRPALRYLVGVGALALMLAAPVATFLVLAKPAAPAQALQPATVSVLPSTPEPSTPIAVFATADRAISAIEEAPRRLPDLLPWLVAAWACGVAFFSLRFAGGFLLLEHRRRTQSHSPGERVLALCLDLQRRLGLDRAIQYLECAWVEAPAVIGWLRPAVLLPVFALTGLSEEQVRAVIAHELAHIRRHDWLVNLFQVLAETLLFYHPAMWWLNRRIRIERELCCDEIAVLLTGSRLEYARALAQMAEWKNVSLLAMAANRGPLTQRVLHILGRKPGAGQRVAGLTGGVLFLSAALAAANLLFGIAYPVQMAEAKESVKVALVSSQAAVAGLARKVVLTAKDAAPPAMAPDQMDATADGNADRLAVPSSDLSRLLPDRNLATPNVVASNDPRPAQPSPNAPLAAALNDQPSALPITHNPLGGPFQATVGTPPAAPPKLDPNEPYKITRCNVPNGARTCDLVTLASAAAPGLGSSPRAKSELAMKCWLGLVEGKGCWKSVCGGGDAGPLERVDYLGRTAAGADIYRVRYRYRGAVAYGISPDPQGTADQYLVKATDPYWIKREISSPAAPILIYARPEDAPPAGCGGGGIAGRQLNPPYSLPSLIQPATTP